MEQDKTIYSISIDDVNQVAGEVLSRPLTKQEIKKISEKLGDNIDWFQAIENTLSDLKIK